VVPITIPAVPGAPPPLPADLVATVNVGPNRTVSSAGVADVVPVLDQTGAVVAYTIEFVFNQSLTSACTCSNGNNGNQYGHANGNNGNNGDNGRGQGNGNAATLTATGTDDLQLTVTVEDLKFHTAFTQNAVFAIPGLDISLESLPPYRARVSITVATGSRVRAVRALAYAEPSSSGVSFAARTDPTADCRYDPANVSCGCGPVDLVAASPDIAAVAANATNTTANKTTLVFDIFAETPGYFSRDLPVRLHITSDNAPANEVVIRLTRNAPLTSGILVSAPGLAPMTPVPAVPGGSPGNVPNASTTTAVPVVTLPPETQPPELAQSFARGIFQPGGACGAAVNFLALTIILLLIAMALRVVATVVLRRRAGHRADDIRTHDTGAVRSLACSHLFVGLVVPCHHFCGPAHTSMFAVHVLAVFAVGAGMLNAFPDIVSSSGSFSAAVTAATLAAFVATVLQAIIAVPFGMYRAIDTRTFGAGAYGTAAAGDGQKDLRSYGVKGNSAVGISESTADAVDALDFDEPVGPMTAAAAAAEPGFDDLDAAYSTSPRSAGAAGNSSPSDDDVVLAIEPKAEDTGAAPAAIPETSTRPCTADDSKSGTGSSAAGTRSLNDTKSLRAAGASCTVRDPTTCVVIHSRNFTIVGHVASVVLSVLLALWTAASIAPWCAPEYAAFGWLLLYAALFDATAAQGAVVGGTYVWRWLNTDEDDALDDDDDNDGDCKEPTGGDAGTPAAKERVVHTLHPIHGQWRYVGPLL
jgi:hypothetical protein